MQRMCQHQEQFWVVINIERSGFDRAKEVDIIEMDGRLVDVVSRNKGVGISRKEGIGSFEDDEFRTDRARGGREMWAGNRESCRSECVFGNTSTLSRSVIQMEINWNSLR